MKICTFCDVTYDDKDYLCWKCEEYLVEAKECPSCGEWTDADFDICDSCHMDWVGKFFKHMGAFIDETTEAQRENLEKWMEGESLCHFYLRARKAYPHEQR